MAQEIEDIASLKLPEALKQLKGGYEAMEKIARYCHGAQKKKDYQQIYIQSQDYSKDALTNAAYHVNAIGIHLTQFLSLQAERVEQLDIHIKILSDVRHFSSIQAQYDQNSIRPRMLHRLRSSLPTYTVF